MIVSVIDALDIALLLSENKSWWWSSSSLLSGVALHSFTCTLHQLKIPLIYTPRYLDGIHHGKIKFWSVVRQLKSVWVLSPFVPDYDNDFKKENMLQTSLKNLNLGSNWTTNYMWIQMFQIWSLTKLVPSALLL